MTTIIRRLFPSRGPAPRSGEESEDDSMNTSEQDAGRKDEEEIPLDDWPYIINSIYYLIVIIFIGLPMWYYTCTSIRYPLPGLTHIENNFATARPRLHLDISVVQLVTTMTTRDSYREPTKEKQLEFLRNYLPDHLNTTLDGLVYNLSWRIRRPTEEETQMLQTIIKENQSTANSEQRREIYAKLEANLLKIHKPFNRFRLFMYIVDGPLETLVCTRPHSYLINVERFIYICPGASDKSTADLINNALKEIYERTVDQQRVKKILGAKTDLLISLIPETEQINLTSLSEVADKVHRVHEKNIRSKYLELAGILNIRLLTQVIYLLQGDALDKMLANRVASKSLAMSANLSESQPAEGLRLLSSSEMARFFHNYESRLNKHSSQNVHHVVTLVPNPSKPAIAFEETHKEVEEAVSILEERDANFILIGDTDKSLVLGMRAIVRRVIGLRSVNLCPNCLIRRDVFLNKWELDAIVGSLIMLKLESVLTSLKSISQQAIGIKIPKYVSNMVFEAHALTLKCLDNLETKKPLEAYHAISAAYELSESAYYDPSLLETLYFPDETKYAIYMPLFLPIAWPLALSVIRVARYLFFGSRHKQKTD